MNTALNRTGVALLTNKSGGSVAQGDVVIVDTANASAFTTTTTAGFVNGLIGVVIEPNGIANNSLGLVAFGIWSPKINLNTAATIGQFIKHHSVAKQGTPHSSPMVAGDFAIALEASATPAGLLLGSIFQGGGGATTIVSAQRTAGDLTLNNSGGFTDLTTSIDLTIAAVTGDKICISLSGIFDAGSGSGNWTAIDAATRVSAADVNFVSNGTGTPENLGVPAWFNWESPDTLNGEWIYTVQAGDISGGNVTLRFKYKTGAASNRTLRAATGQPLTAWVKNFRQ